MLSSPASLSGSGVRGQRYDLRDLLSECKEQLQRAAYDPERLLAADIVSHLLSLHAENRLTLDTMDLLLESVSSVEEVQLLALAAREPSLGTHAA